MNIITENNSVEKIILVNGEAFLLDNSADLKMLDILENKETNTFERIENDVDIDTYTKCLGYFNHYIPVILYQFNNCEGCFYGTKTRKRYKMSF